MQHTNILMQSHLLHDTISGLPFRLVNLTNVIETKSTIFFPSHFQRGKGIMMLKDREWVKVRMSGYKTIMNYCCYYIYGLCCCFSLWCYRYCCHEFVSMFTGILINALTTHPLTHLFIHSSTYLRTQSPFPVLHPPTASIHPSTLSIYSPTHCIHPIIHHIYSSTHPPLSIHPIHLSTHPSIYPIYPSTNPAYPPTHSS